MAGNRVKKLMLALVFASGYFVIACGQQEAEKFDLELSKQKWNGPGLTWSETDLRRLHNGEKLFLKKCSVCHKGDGRGDVNLGAPALPDNPLVNGQKSVLIQRILEGKTGTAMPAFAAALSDEEIAQLSTYLRNAWGNYASDSVTAAEVEKLR